MRPARTLGLAILLGALGALEGPASARAETAPGAEAPAAGDAPRRKPGTLLDPTPRESLRPLSTDRPDRTETPVTVDAGHVQLEMDVLAYSYDRVRQDSLPITTHAFVLGGINLKLGVSDSADLEVIVPLYERVLTRDRGTGDTTSVEGVGDLTLRLKVNVLGNDGGAPVIVALMPWLQLPTARRGLGADRTAAGVTVPVAFEVPSPFDVGVTFDAGFRDGETRRVDAELTGSGAVGVTLFERLRFYAELWASATTAPHDPWIATFDLGTSFKITPDVQLDAGVNVGLTRATDDVNPFLGVTVRY